MQPVAIKATVPDGASAQRSFEAPDVGILRDLQGWRDALADADRAEACAALVATAFAVRQLKSLDLAGQAFPDGLLHGRTTAASPEALAALSAYVDQLNQLRRAAQQSDDRLHRLLAPGLEIVVLSIRALMHKRQLLLEGQALWRELTRGIADYPAVYRQLVAPDASAEQIADDLFLPAALVPIAARGG
jgi:hypothetical protein